MIYITVYVQVLLHNILKYMGLWREYIVHKHVPKYKVYPTNTHRITTFNQKSSSVGSGSSSSSTPIVLTISTCNTNP